MHYFQFNIGDYASHTRHLSLLEDLAYRRLLDLYYLKEGEIYGDEADVARQIGMRDNVCDVTQVLQDFFYIGTDDRWTHDRCDAEIMHFRQKSEKASNAGKASAKRRLNKRSTDVQPTNNHKPITNNQEPKEVSSKEDLSSDADQPVTPKEIIDAWNQIAKRAGLSEIKVLNSKRMSSLKARIKECPDVDTWSMAFQNIEKSKFLCGDNDRGWKANFDFILQPSSFTKLIEGAY